MGGEGHGDEERAFVLTMDDHSVGVKSNDIRFVICQYALYESRRRAHELLRDLPPSNSLAHLLIRTHIHNNTLTSRLLTPRFKAHPSPNPLQRSMANQHRPVNLLPINEKTRQPYPVSPIYILWRTRHKTVVVALGRPRDLVLRFPRWLCLKLNLARVTGDIDRDVDPTEGGRRVEFCCCGVEPGFAVRERACEIMDHFL